MRHPHPPPFDARWHARWIWFEQPRIHSETATRPVLTDPRDRIGLFRRAIELDRVPDAVPARIWVDGRYVLTVNGAEVARGPVRSEPRSAHYDVVDLAPHLVAGVNIVGIAARHYGEATSWWTPVPPTYSLGAGSVLFEALVGDEWVVSDRSWRCTPGRAWTPVAVPGDVACLPIESFDARAHDEGWDLDDFEDASWADATEITPMHTGGSADPHPRANRSGCCGPRCASPSPAAPTMSRCRSRSWSVAVGATLDDPVAQVLADQAATPLAAG